jgi:hypothetical protein
VPWGLRRKKGYAIGMSPSERDDRVKQFKATVEALNNQFMTWASKQLENSPTRFWSTGMQVGITVSWVWSPPVIGSLAGTPVVPSLPVPCRRL